MLWYLFKTWVGREKELVRMIRRTVPPEMYQECFVIEQERIWRKQQRSIVHMELLFPGCVFFTCKEKRFPHSFLEYLERIPDVAQWTSCGVLTIFPMMREDRLYVISLKNDMLWLDGGFGERNRRLYWESCWRRMEKGSALSQLMVIHAEQEGVLSDEEL